MKDAAWFAIVMVVFIGFLWWHDCRKDEKEDKRKRGE